MTDSPTMKITFTHIMLAALAGLVWWQWDAIGPLVHAALDRLPQATPVPGPTPRHGGGPQSRPGEIDYRMLVGNIFSTYADLMRDEGRTFQKPKVVLVDSGEQGPYYDPDTKRILMPETVVTEIRRRTNCRPENCTYVVFWVLSHETGHAVEDQLGLLSRGGGPAIELAADCMAGAVAKFEDSRLRKEGKPALIEPGDIEAAIRFAGSIGGPGHGSGAQRQASFRRGWERGTLAACVNGGLRMAGVE